MRRTGQSVWGHPHAAAVFSNRSMNASGSSCGPIFCTGMWVGGAGVVELSPARTSRSITAPSQLAVLPLSLDEGRQIFSPGLPSCPSAPCGVLVEVPRSDWITSANGDPVGEDMMAAAFRLPSPGFGNQCTKFVMEGRKRTGLAWEDSGEIYSDKLKTAAHSARSKNINSSVVSAINLSIPFRLVSPLTRTVRPSLHSVSLLEFPLPRWLY